MEPRVYRTGGGWRVFGIGFGAVMITIGVFLFATALFQHSSNFIAYPMGALAIYMGFCLAANAMAGRVVFYPDAIEVSNFFKSRRLNRDEIGAKTFWNASCPIYLLYPLSRDLKTLKVEAAFRQDATFKDWMAGIPDANKDFFRQRVGSQAGR
jgi:hypothetical protein